MTSCPLSLAPLTLTREAICDDRLGRLAEEAQRAGHLTLLDPEIREAGRRAALARLAPHDDLWVFAYGSLMWNPACHVSERVPAVAHGYHRAFCIWTLLGRGSPDNPGLVLGLRRGGSCRGLVLRIAAEHVESETAILWRREMLDSIYRPVWLSARTPAGRVPALAFAVDPAHPRVAHVLDPAHRVRAMATAAGHLGTAYDYLRSTVAHLDDLGCGNGAMHRLLRDVEAYRRGPGGAA